MPELPEVETIRVGLERFLPGRTVAAARVSCARSVRRHVGGPEDFEQTVVGRVFAAPRRRGKYLWLPFTDGDALGAHLGMSGQFRVGAAVPPHTRVEFVLDDQTVVRFVDQRQFGGLWLSPGGADGPAEIAHIAADLFAPGLDEPALVSRVERAHRGIKRVLLDQGVVSGIGNIYADEALWRARTHYAALADELPPGRVGEILAAARAVMDEALAQGGTSFDALYVGVDGESGYFERALDAYGREGRPCPRCGAPIVREPFMGRSSFRCPDCQPARPAPGSRLLGRDQAVAQLEL